MCHVCGNSCHEVIQVYCGCLVFDVSSGHSFLGCTTSRGSPSHFSSPCLVMIRDRRLPTRLRLGENMFSQHDYTRC